jgi:hypothetical protein
MAGPVYDSKNGTLRLCSTARVDEENYSLVRSLLSVASVLQIAEVRTRAEVLARALHGDSATSAHPHSGKRHHPDELANIVPN